MPKKNIPSYRLHKATGQAIVVLKGKTFYLGKWKTLASREREEFSQWKWRLVRRGSEILKHFVLTGTIEIVSIRPWEPVLRKPRQSVELDKPTPEQLTDPDDLFALIWRVKQAILKAGLTKQTVRHYTAEGMTVILRKHTQQILVHYSEALASEAVAEIRSRYEQGLTSRVSYQNLRKIYPLTPPEKPADHERQYISALFDAYDDAADGDSLPSDDITKHPKFDRDLKQRRIEYFAAEAVRCGTRENFRNNDPDNLFTALMTETLDGVSDVHTMDYRHGFERLLSVMKHATSLHLENCIIGRIPDWVGPSQKKGVCHMLVNEGQIKGWVDSDE